jgi:hypothetical protein
MRTLHIVDGDSAGGTMRVSGFAKRLEILRWRDALYMGPVPADLTHRQLSRLRSRFWTKGKSVAEFNQRDAALHRQGDFEEIVLWFGSECTLCQLSFLQLLNWFSEQKTAASRLFRVAEEAGTLAPTQLGEAYAKRQPVTPGQMRMAGRVWKAFRSSTPAALSRAMKPKIDILPGMRATIAWLLGEYPHTRGGLSRLENGLLRAIESRGEAKASVAVGTVMIKEYIGDILLFDMLRGFVTARHPLVRFSQPFADKIGSWKFNASTLTLTDTGQNVLSGGADNIKLNGIDRWIGGVHLSGNKVRWRWDERTGEIVSRH